MRSNPVDSARRAFLGFVRGTVYSVDDSTKIQSHTVRGLQNEMLTEVERFQEYGFSSVPMPPDANGGAAEVAMAFASGNRSHPIIIATDDRRTRPQNWNPGDAGLWHHQGATAKITATGWQYNAGSQNQPHVTTVGNAVFTVANGKITMQVGGSSGPAVVVKADFAYIGGDPDQGGDFEFIETVAGPSSKAKAKL